MIIKIWAYGFWEYRIAYFKMGWNLNDFLILLVSYIKYFFVNDFVPDLGINSNKITLLF